MYIGKSALDPTSISTALGQPQVPRRIRRANMRAMRLPSKVPTDPTERFRWLRRRRHPAAGPHITPDGQVVPSAVYMDHRTWRAFLARRVALYRSGHLTPTDLATPRALSAAWRRIPISILQAAA